MKITRKSFMTGVTAAVLADWAKPVFAEDAARPFGAGARVPAGRIRRLLARALDHDVRPKAVPVKYDAANCVKYTGRPLAPVLENMRHLSAAKRRIVMRCPMIPGINDGEAEIKARGALADELDAVESVDVLPSAVGSSTRKRKAIEAMRPTANYGTSLKLRHGNM